MMARVVHPICLWDFMHMVLSYHIHRAPIVYITCHFSGSLTVYVCVVFDIVGTHHSQYQRRIFFVSVWSSNV